MKNINKIISIIAVFAFMQMSWAGENGPRHHRPHHMPKECEAHKGDHKALMDCIKEHMSKKGMHPSAIPAGTHAEPKTNN